MARKTSPKPDSGQSTATIGFEGKLWLAADKLRNNMPDELGRDRKPRHRTTIAEISKQNFHPIRIVPATKELMAAFTTKVAPLYAQITANLAIAERRGVRGATRLNP